MVSDKQNFKYILLQVYIKYFTSSSNLLSLSLFLFPFHHINSNFTRILPYWNYLIWPKDLDIHMYFCIRYIVGYLLTYISCLALSIINKVLNWFLNLFRSLNIMNIVVATKFIETFILFEWYILKDQQQWVQYSIENILKCWVITYVFFNYSWPMSSRQRWNFNQIVSKHIYNMCQQLYHQRVVLLRK